MRPPPGTLPCEAPCRSRDSSASQDHSHYPCGAPPMTRSPSVPLSADEAEPSSRSNPNGPGTDRARAPEMTATDPRHGSNTLRCRCQRSRAPENGSVTRCALVDTVRAGGHSARGWTQCVPVDVGWRHEAPHPREHRCHGQPALPRSDDVRGLGQHRPRRLRPHHPPGPRRRHQLHRHRGRLLGRRVRGDRGQGALVGRPVAGGPRHQGPRPDGRRPQRPGELATLDRRRVREQPPPARHRLHRPVPDPPSGRARRSTSTTRSAR